MTPANNEAVTELLRLLMGASFRAGKFSVKGTRAEFDAAVETERQAHEALLAVLRGVSETETIPVTDDSPFPLAEWCIRCGFQRTAHGCECGRLAVDL